jgi:hypothetical protein
MKPTTAETEYLEMPYEVPRKYEDVRRLNRHGMNWIQRAAGAHYWQGICAVLDFIQKDGLALVTGLTNQLDKDGNNALVHASIKEANEGRLETIKALCRYEAGFKNVRGSSSGWTIGHWLAYNGDLESLMMLENNGMCCFLPDKKGNFPIDIAGFRGHDKVVSFLIKAFLEQRKQAIEAVGKFKAAAKNAAKDDPKPMDYDEYHPFFVASDYLYMVVTYWALYINRTTRDLLEDLTGDVLESVGSFLARSGAKKPSRSSSSKRKSERPGSASNIDHGQRVDTDAQSLKYKPSASPTFDHLPLLTLRIPTLGHNSLFHAAAASDSSKGLFKLFRLIPKYIDQKLPVAADLLYLPKNHPFETGFLRDVQKEIDLIAKTRSDTILPDMKQKKSTLGLNDWEWKNDLGETPLHVATRRRQTLNVKMLLDQGSDFLETNNNLWTAPNLAMDDFTLDTYVSWFKQLRLSHLKGQTFYLKRGWIQEKGLIKKTGCCKRKPRVYVDNMNEQIKAELDKLSTNMVFNAESTSFYYLGFVMKMDSSKKLQQRLEAADRADFIVDVLKNHGYTCSIVSASVPDSLMLMVHASNKKLNEVGHCQADLHQARNPSAALRPLGKQSRSPDQRIRAAV